LVKDFEKRRDEVIKRAKSPIPDDLLFRREGLRFEDYIYWILEPHIIEKYIPYKIAKDENIRTAQSALTKIMYKIPKEDLDKIKVGEVSEKKTSKRKTKRNK
jgi:hypothetical protein